MSLNPSSSKDFLYLYGNHSISNQTFRIGDFIPDFAAGVDIQSLKLARTSGITPSNFRQESKTMNLPGEVAVADSLETFKIEELKREINKIFSYQKRLLRVVPSYIRVSSPDDILDWTASGDATNLTGNTVKFQFGSKSINFDIDVSQDGGNSAVLTADLSTPVDVSSLIDKGSLDFWLELEDVYFVENIVLEFGSSSSDYWTYTFDKNYEGLSFENGVNYLSCPFSISTTAPCFVEHMTEVGTPDLTVASHIKITINYSESQEDMAGCKFGDFFVVDDNLAINYLCWRRGEITNSKNWDYSRRIFRYSANLLNSTGFGQSTHSLLAFNETGISSPVFDVKTNLEGSFRPLPSVNFTLVDPSNISQLTFENLTENSTVVFQNTWEAGDSVVIDNMIGQTTRNGSPQPQDGVFNKFGLGSNRLRLTAGTGEATAELQQLNQDGFYVVQEFAQDGTDRWVAQSFESPITGLLNSVTIIQEGFAGNPPAPAGNALRVALYSNSGGDPGAELAAIGTGFRPFGSPDEAIVFLNTPVTVGTTYWLVFSALGGDPITPANGRIYKNSSGGYADGLAKTSTNAGSTWTAQTNEDIFFKLAFEASQNVDINFSLSYKRLYA